MSSDNREMIENHRVLLLQTLGMQAYEELPKKAEDEYWKLKRLFDRTGSIIRPSDLGMMCLTLGYGKPTKDEQLPPTIADMWRKKQIKRDETIQVKWRDAWVDAAIKGVTGQNEVIAQVVGDPDERRFGCDDARVTAA